MIFNRQNCFKKIILKTEHIPTHQASCIQTVNDIKKKKKEISTCKLTFSQREQLQEQT